MGFPRSSTTAPRSRSTGVRACCATFVLLAAFATPASADTVIATAPCPAAGPGTTVAPNGCSPISAHGGRVVWSAYDASTGRYTLMTAAGGAVGAVPVPARSRPFDADLGEDNSRRVVVTYSRCAGDPAGPPAGCGVYEYVFAAGSTERSLLPGTRDPRPLLPSRWHDRVVIARRSSPSSPRVAMVCAASGAPACARLPGGPAGDTPSPDQGPTAIDIDARRAAVGWLSRSGDTRHHAILLWSLRATTKPTTIVRVGAGLAGNAAVHSPTLDGAFVYYARGSSSCDYPSTPNAAGRYDLARRTITEVSTPALAGLAVDGDTTFYAACTPYPAAPRQGAATSIVRADPQPFRRPGTLDPARAAACPASRPSAGWSTQTFARRPAPFALALAGDPSGHAIALWPRRAALEYAVRRSAGSFGGVRRLTATGGGDVPQVASDGTGRVVVAWAVGGDRGSAIRVSTGTTSGGLSAPQTLDSITAGGPDGLGRPLVAMAADGGAVVAWTRSGSTGADAGLLVAFRAAGANRFGTPARIATGPALTRVLALATGAGGRALLALTGYFGTQVNVVEGTAAGFGAPAALVARDTPSIGSAALGAGGAATLAWSAGGAIQTATRTAGGQFAPVASVSTRNIPAEPSSLSLAAFGSRVAVAWSERDVRRTVARLMVADGRIGSPLAGARALRPRRGRVEDVHLALGARGAATLAYKLSCRTAGSRVMVASRRSRAVPLGAPTVVSGRDRNARGLTVALGRGGRPTVGWVTSLRGSAAGLVRLAGPRRPTAE